jgi:heme-degrading monooxygenase HmoA
MTIRVLMFRKVQQLTVGIDEVTLPKLSEMLKELRTMAHQQPGYISGETLRNVNDPNEYLVISTWKSLAAWQQWLANEKREELEGRVDALIGSSTVYKVFSYG